MRKREERREREIPGIATFDRSKSRQTDAEVNKKKKTYNVNTKRFETENSVLPSTKLTWYHSKRQALIVYHGNSRRIHWSFSGLLWFFSISVFHERDGKSWKALVYRCVVYEQRYGRRMANWNLSRVSFFFFCFFFSAHCGKNAEIKLHRQGGISAWFSVGSSILKLNLRLHLSSV